MKRIRHLVIVSLLAISLAAARADEATEAAAPAGTRYMLVMTFRTPFAQASIWNAPCPDEACVANAIEHAHESVNLVRLRVYEMPLRLNSISLVPMSGAIRDEWFL